MQGTSLEIRYGWRTGFLGLVSAAAGIGMIWGSTGLARMDCHGRNAWFCELLLNLPEWGRIVFWVTCGVLALLAGAVIFRRIFAGEPAITLDGRGVSFRQGGDVFVPWNEVKSLSTTRRWVRLESTTPKDVKAFSFIPRSISNFRIPYSGGRAYVGGEKVSGSAERAIDRWVKGLLQSGPADAASPAGSATGERIEPW